MDMRELASHLLRRSRLIIACVAAALLVAILYLLLTPSEYLATASLLFDPNANGNLTADTGIARTQPDPMLVENQVRLVFSDDVLRRVVDREKLTTDSEFGLRPKGIVGQLLERLGLSQRPTSEDVLTATITSLREHIYTRRSERTFVIDVGVYAREAQKSARLTDALAQAFIDEGTAARVAFARQQSDEIRTKLADLKARIETAETRVQQYKAANNIFDNDGKVLATQQLADAERDLAQAHLRVLETKARLDQLRASLAAGRDPGDALRSPSIERIKAQIADIIRQQANLRTTLGPRHPALLESENQLRDARALLQAELRRLAEGARNDYDTAVANEAELQKRVAEIRAKASSTNEALVKMRELQRDVEASQAIYDRFLKASGFVASDQLATPTARIIAAATIPTRPESPRRLVVLSASLAVGLGLGLFLALIGAARIRRPAGTSPQGSASGAGLAGAATPARQAAESGARATPRRATASLAGPDEGPGAEPGADAPSADGTSPPAVETAPPAVAEPLAAAQASPTDGPVPEVAARPIEPHEPSPPRVAEAPAPARSAAEETQSSVFAEAELPDHFEIPQLATPAGAALSLTQRLRATRENPGALLPHRREVELHPASPYSRVVRDLRRAVSLRGEARPLLVALVSELRGCGKSTLAMNLARAFADSGARVLILDADRRNATLTQAVGTDAEEGRLRLADAVRPVFALDGSWRSGVFLSSLALGRSEAPPGSGRPAPAPMPNFPNLRSLADVLIVDAQSGTRGPALGPDLPIGVTLTFSPGKPGAAALDTPPFAQVELATGQGNPSRRVSPRNRELMDA
jgi:uncharacterized protein involved in exopolysaccharide biosynthesis/Mrp family chromosome partitioning ATPase